MVRARWGRGEGERDCVLWSSAGAALEGGAGIWWKLVS